MSGGVDSSVAAAILKQQGYEVIGITMCFGTKVGVSVSAKRPLCCGPEQIEDARRVANALKIKHYALSFSKDLERYVIKNFLDEYSAGRTPNPCVRCNRFIKFGTLLKKARSLEAQFLATGHYARIEFNRKLAVYLLKKGRDKTKDQSYFLYSIEPKVLAFILMPLAKYTKVEVRKLAKKFNLPVADKPASQEICFVTDADYRGFLQGRLSPLESKPLTGLMHIKKKIKPGLIVDKKGKVLGEHKGIAFYTIGQRQGLGVAYKEPLYIIDIDSATNTITLGAKQETYVNGLIASELNFLYPLVSRRLDVKAKIRYNQQEIKARLRLFDSAPKHGSKALSAEVIFSQPVNSVARGQSVVFYQSDIVIGGGIIKAVLK